MKLIIPLLDDNISSEDISSETGFVDGYTTDKNKPGNEGCIFLMYDCDSKTPQAYNRDCKFRKSPFLKSSRIIRVDNHPYILYTFAVINKDIKQFRKGLQWTSYDSFNRIVSFWNPNEKDVFDALMWHWKPYEISNKSVPEEDYAQELSEA